MVPSSPEDSATALLDLAPDAIFACGADRRITSWNRGAELTYGYSSAEALGRTPGALPRTEYPLPLEEASPGPHVRLRVSDTGIGMSAETVHRAFDPFYTTKGPGEATGLGLATVYGIIQQAGGCCQIYSEPGVGTTLTVLLPSTDQGVASSAKTPARSPSRELMSGFAEPILDYGGHLGEGVALIEKPFSGPALLRKLSQVLERREP